MRRLTVIAITVLSTLAATAGALSWWFTSSYVTVSADEGVLVIKRVGSMPNLYSTKDGLLVLTSEQAIECAGGGRCAIFSEREFAQEVARILLTLQGKGGPDA